MAQVDDLLDRLAQQLLDEENTESVEATESDEGVEVTEAEPDEPETETDEVAGLEEVHEGTFLSEFEGDGAS